MRLLVCGGREYDDTNYAHGYLDSLHALHGFTLLISGGARGADRIGEAWAKSREVPVEVYPADWQRLGKSAGHIRNAVMLRDGQPDMVVAFPGGRGTENMVRIAKLRKDCHVIEVSPT